MLRCCDLFIFDFGWFGGFWSCCLLVDWLLGLIACGGCYWFRVARFGLLYRLVVGAALLLVSCIGCLVAYLWWVVVDCVWYFNSVVICKLLFFVGLYL